MCMCVHTRMRALTQSIDIYYHKGILKCVILYTSLIMLALSPRLCMGLIVTNNQIKWCVCVCVMEEGFGKEACIKQCSSHEITSPLLFKGEEKRELIVYVGFFP